MHRSSKVRSYRILKRAVILIVYNSACIGCQVIASVTYTYLADCYRPQMPECSQALNFSRQTFGLTLTFYSLPLGNKIGFQFAFIIYSLVFLASFVCIFVPLVCQAKLT